MGKDLPEKAAKDLKFITDAARRMQLLVNDLLALSRSARVEIRRQRISLDSYVDEALAALSMRIEESGAEIEREELPTVSGDRTLLTGVFQNLLSNALKFTRPGVRPAIRLTVERVGDEVALGVLDNGIGIKPEYTQKIFLPFQRLHGRGQYEGSGIGLGICRKVVERHGGHIWVESEPGQGSHFRFTLRAPKETKACIDQPTSLPSSSSSRTTPATKS